MTRSTLDICQEIREAELKAERLKVELMLLTGMEYEEFLAGMRRLLEVIEVSHVTYDTQGNVIDRRRLDL